MSNYPLRANKYNWRSFTPETNHYYTDEYTASMYDLYLTNEYIRKFSPCLFHASKAL